MSSVHHGRLVSFDKFLVQLEKAFKLGCKTILFSVRQLNESSFDYIFLGLTYRDVMAYL